MASRPPEVSADSPRRSLKLRQASFTAAVWRMQGRVWITKSTLALCKLNGYTHARTHARTLPHNSMCRTWLLHRFCAWPKRPKPVTSVHPRAPCMQGTRDKTSGEAARVGGCVLAHEGGAVAVQAAH